ncbi:MAG TPA: response regulator [Bryobacteraceae bacterium]|nr:response regulator [Bryobacteraceae bacterium]
MKILIIDDDPLDRVVFKRYLNDSQPGEFVFSEESSGRAGVARAMDFQPDCILLDFNLPDLDGASVLRLLRNGAEELPYPVVMLTAIGNERIAVEAMKLGVMDYLPKGPAAAEALSRTVRNAVSTFSMRREIALQKEALQQRNRDLEAIQKTLIEEKDRYRTLTEAIPQLVWTATSSGEVQYANRRMREFAGDPPDENWNLESLVHGEDRPLFESAWERAIRGGWPVEMELRLCRSAEGACRRHLLRAVRLNVEPGRPPSWIGTCTDIEDQKRNEEAIRQQQKLESIGLLAGGIAHDFNNLLVGIMGGISFALDLLGPNHEVNAMLKTALSSSERAAQLTQQMLAYAGKGEMFVEPVNVAQVMSDSCDLVRASVPWTVHLNCTVQKGMPLIQASATQLQQLIMNLVINGAEALAGKIGIVSVTAKLIRLGNSEKFPNLLGYEIPPGDYVEVRVSDTGCGMDEATVSRIFDPFFTTKFTGRGLGLAAVQGIVRSLQGGITVSSTTGKGSTFRLVFPAKSAERKPQADQAEATVAPVRILVIDDEEIVRRAVRGALEKAGHTVLEAEDGASGLQLFAREEDVSLILLDLSMPRMSGLQVFRELRKLSPAVPVAIMSGYSEREMALQFAGACVLGFVQKPFTASSLVKSVSTLIEKIRLRNNEEQSGHS